MKAARLALVALVVSVALYMIAKTRKGRTLADSKRFAARLGPIALRVQRDGGVAPDGTRVAPGIHADLGVIQALHESDAGLSQLAQPFPLGGNNIFGMTAEPGTYWRSQGRPFVEIETEEEDKAGRKFKTKRPFRVYSSWADSYLDWARRVQKPDFAPVRAAAERGDLRAFAAALVQVKYATDSGYASKIIGVAQEIA